jgi:NitT/TauT family transport system ATP-binding protein
MGSSGKGKTTLLNLVLGLQKPDNGVVSVESKNISAVFQEDRLCEDFTAVANVVAVTGKKVPREKIVELLKELELSGNENEKVKNLSGGMKRRVAIARCLLAESNILLLDEPFKGLDDQTRETVSKVILASAVNKTLLVSTHDIRDAELLNAEIFELK